jgi:4-hydroxy-2-oxoheptanedioate aldolase
MKSLGLRARLQAGEALIGVLAGHRDPMLAEQIGLLGMDFFMLDAEHGALDPRDAEAIVRGCESVLVTPLARVRSLDAKLIAQFLDAGVQGVMLPGVSHPDEVAALVDAVRYPPIGRRGFGPARSAGYLLSKRPQRAILAETNARTLVLPQIEDIRAVDRIEQLLAVPGIDGVMIGPVDLSLSMGFLDGPDRPEVSDAMDRVLVAARRAGVPVGTVAGNGERARALIARGYRILLAPFSALLATAARTYLTDARG